MLTKLGSRRRAQIDPADCELFAEDLVEFPIEEVEAVLNEIGLRPRGEFESGFPDIGTLRAPLLRKRAYREQEAEMKRYLSDRDRRENPEKYVSLREIGRDRKTPVQEPRQAHTREEIDAAIAASKVQAA